VIRLALLLALIPGAALAHTLTATPWRGPEPVLAIPMLVAGGLYLAGWLRLRRRIGEGRRTHTRHGLLFAAGWLTLAGATLTPLHDLGARSFAAHMLEHELIMLAAAPLFVLSRPGAALLWAFPAPARQALATVPRSRAGGGLWRFLTDPILATTVQAAAIWLWHLPSLFDQALRSEAWHVAQHASFFVTALLFWSAMLGPRRSVWTAALCLFATSMVTGALGAFMALSQSPWYQGYAALGLAAFGLSPAQDQQAAGLLMWIPGGLFHALVAIALIAPHLTDALREPRHG
jgi:putative membrane protein